MCGPKITHLSPENKLHIMTRLRNDILNYIQLFQACVNEWKRFVQRMRTGVPPCCADLGQQIAEYESNLEALMAGYERLLQIIDSLLQGQFLINIE